MAPTVREDAAGVAMPLDELLTQAAAGPLRRFLPDRSTLRFAAALARNPGPIVSRVGDTIGELGRIAAGRSTVEPTGRDKRFADPAWSQNPVLRRLVQSYLVLGRAAGEVVEDVPMDWRDTERVRFATSNLIEALAPSNNPFVTPLGWKALIDTGGANVLRGARALLRDLSSPPRVPTMVDPSAYTVGIDLGVSPGSVVLRSEVLEVIQYGPQTETVRTVPLLIIPPTINKFYVLDLAPGRSLIEYLVGQGQQVFVISWRNPEQGHRDWGFDRYATAILEAFDAVDEITGAGSAHVVAACSGGLLAAMTAAHRAAVGGTDRLASLSLLVTMVDQSRAGMTSAMLDEEVAAAAVARSQQVGYLDGRNLAEIFAWLRPSDLIWNYWVNNYIQGRPPPKFDILFWNADTTRMTAALHRDFVDVALHNRLARPGEVTVLGSEIDLGKITVDSYVVAGSADHICPWVNCYRSSQLLGGKVRFVLSTNGHIAALVNPPGNSKSGYQVSDDNTLEPDDWRRAAATRTGSWWPDYADWLAARSGNPRPAPGKLGSARHPVIGDAPGTYVLDR